ncbi:hypothetical protein G647_01491 [Cladophialophora carrionii CBS 160.54]|uniref:Xylanolytic transcriptional activator regulatory domain-containing protein n=1 Tax=Cladophialophora carrionii CBS 160.54 TaxID=1279043 RepID=V9DRU9_9EURO|nr:uncharacterized protein G647_01491 [Cladophialophora carrionii CBS 160.54]ETI29038.1 hypothetical protein G647_01491 [Cladophialophora carrionii CBS 160.54]
MAQGPHQNFAQLLAETRALTGDDPSFAADTGQSQTLSVSSRYRGLSNPSFSFALAQQSLELMSLGLSTDVYEAIPGSRTSSGPQPSRSSTVSHTQLPPDPLREMSRDQTHHLIDVFDDEVGHVYPVLDIVAVHQSADLLHNLIQLARQTRRDEPLDYKLSGVEEVEIDILLVVLANGLFLQEHSQSKLGLRLFDVVRGSMERLTSAAEVRTQHILFLLLSSISYFCQDEEILAWRTVGLAARLSQEIDLHRLGTILTTTRAGDEGVRIIRLFWSIYILDRRWSLGTGLPFTIKDSDIDMSLPKPDEGAGYLRAMADLYQLTGRAWSFISGGTSKMNGQREVNSEPPPNQRMLDYLQGQFLAWHRSLPLSLTFQNPKGRAMPDDREVEQPRRLQSLRAQLYLRSNEMRILLYRPLLFSPNLLRPRLATAKMVVSTATDSIRVLWHLHKMSGLYEKLQVCFNHFLESSVAVLFLALAHAPYHFASANKEGIGLAKEIIGNLAATSPVSRRLYRRIMHLEGLANGLQVIQGCGNLYQPSSRPPLPHTEIFDVATLSQEPQLYENATDWSDEAAQEPEWLPPHVGDEVHGTLLSNVDFSGQIPHTVEVVDSFEPQWEDGAFDGLFTTLASM